MIIKTIQFVLVALCLAAGAAQAQDQSDFKPSDIKQDVPRHEAFDLGVAAFKAHDYTTAIKVWQPLAEAGHAWSQYNMGGMYELGLGVPQSNEKAARWFLAAAKQGNGMAESKLILMLHDGRVGKEVWR